MPVNFIHTAAAHFTASLQPIPAAKARIRDLFYSCRLVDESVYCITLCSKS